MLDDENLNNDSDNNDSSDDNGGDSDDNNEDFDNNESYTEDFSDDNVLIKQFTAPDFDDFDFESFKY